MSDPKYRLRNAQAGGIVGGTPGNVLTIQPDGTVEGEPLPVVPERIPTQMVFTEVFREAWIDQNVAGLPDTRLLPPQLQAVHDQFTDPTTTRFTNVTESNACTISIAAGVLTLSAAAGANRMSLLYEVAGGSLAMPQQFVSVQVTGQTGSLGAYSEAIVGFVKDGANYCVAAWNFANNLIQIHTVVAGSHHFDAAVSAAGWGVPTTIAISMVGTWLTVYAKLSGAPTLWVKVTSFDVSVYIDFKAQDLSLWYPCFGHASPGTFANTMTYKNFQAGRFGGVGIRDICVVTHEDGSPYFASPTSVYALATLAGASGGIVEASMGVFIIDLEKKEFTQTGVIMVNRSGKIQNDHAGCMIREDNGDQHLCVSTWGTDPTPTRIEYKFVAAATDLLNGSHVVSAMAILNLTQQPASFGQYDPFLIRLSGVWYMAYTVSTPAAGTPFYPALDDSLDLTTWVNIGSDPTAARYEGTRILPFAGQSYVLTGGQFNMKMYTLAMVYVGIVNCISPGDGTTQPHAMIFPYQNLNLLVTFDQTKWPTVGGLAFSWGSIQWFASPRY